MTLNPNAAEFFPSALKPSRNVEPSGRVVNRSISLSLGASDDDDFTRYWRDHLPDDIIPDFGTVASTRDDRYLEQRYIEEATRGFRPEMLRERDFIDPLALLAQKFPGIAIQSLADVLQANGGELSLTIEMLTYFEFQDDVRSIEQLQSRLPNLTTMDFPAFSGPELSENGSRLFEGLFPSVIYNSDMARGDTASDLVAAVRKSNAAQ